MLCHFYYCFTQQAEINKCVAYSYYSVKSNGKCIIFIFLFLLYCIVVSIFCLFSKNPIFFNFNTQSTPVSCSFSPQLTAQLCLWALVKLQYALDL